MTITDICNLALSYLSKTQIKSLDDGSVEAAQCKMHYDHCRKMLLRNYSWGFASRTVSLAKVNATVPGWDYVYKYPAKCLSVQRVYNENTVDTKLLEPQPFELATIRESQTVLLSNLEDAWADFTYDVDNTEIFSEEFVGALAHFIASDMAINLTGSADLMANNYQQMQAMIQLAKTQAAQERWRPEEKLSHYGKARFGGGI